MSVEPLLEAVVLKPQQDPLYSVIWLHGLGADGHDFEDVVPMLGLKESFQARFIFPHAPVRPITINQGMPMRAWYDIQGLEEGMREDAAGVKDSAKLIEAWIENEASLVGSSKVFLIGFSQGGAMAAHCALRYQDPLAGCAVLSGYICLGRTLKQEVSSANQKLPVYMAHGKQDPMVKLSFAQRSYDLLVDLGLSPQLEIYPMAHNICFEEMKSLGRWMHSVVLQDTV